MWVFNVHQSTLVAPAVISKAATTLYEKIFKDEKCCLWK